MNYFTEEGLKRIRVYSLMCCWEFFAFVAGRNECKRQDILDVIKEKKLKEFYDFGLKVSLLEKIDNVLDSCDSDDITTPLRAARYALSNRLNFLKSFTNHSHCVQNYETDKFPDARECALNGLKKIFTDDMDQHVIQQEFPPDKDATEILFDVMNDIEDYKAKKSKTRDELNLLILTTALLVPPPEGFLNYIEEKGKTPIYELGLKCLQYFKMNLILCNYDQETNELLFPCLSSMRKFIGKESEKCSIGKPIDALMISFGCFWERYFDNECKNEEGIKEWLFNAAYSLFYESGYEPIEDFCKRVWGCSWKDTQQAFSERVLETMKEIEK